MPAQATVQKLTRVLAASVLVMHSVAAAMAADTSIVIKDSKGASFTGDAASGQKTFNHCAQCHKLEAGKNSIGPSLNNVLGRKAGTAVGYTYSVAMKTYGVVWDAQRVSDYIENPRAKVVGTKMSYAGMKKPQDRANVVAYIKKASAPK